MIESSQANRGYEFNDCDKVVKQQHRLGGVSRDPADAHRIERQVNHNIGKQITT